MSNSKDLRFSPDRSPVRLSSPKLSPDRRDVGNARSEAARWPKTLRKSPSSPRGMKFSGGTGYSWETVSELSPRNATRQLSPTMPTPRTPTTPRRTVPVFHEHSSQEKSLHRSVSVASKIPRSNYPFGNNETGTSGGLWFVDNDGVCIMASVKKDESPASRSRDVSDDRSYSQVSAPRLELPVPEPYHTPPNKSHAATRSSDDETVAAPPIDVGSGSSSQYEYSTNPECVTTAVEAVETPEVNSSSSSVTREKEGDKDDKFVDAAYLTVTIDHAPPAHQFVEHVVGTQDAPLDSESVTSCTQIEATQSETGLCIHFIEGNSDVDDHSDCAQPPLQCPDDEQSDVSFIIVNPVDDGVPLDHASAPSQSEMVHHKSTLESENAFSMPWNDDDAYVLSTYLINMAAEETCIL